jgi:hypothetical protein
MRKYYYIIISVIFALLSTFILACELIVFLKLSANYNPYYELLKSITRFYLTELFLLLPLTYMMFCTYYGLFAMKISGLISFNKHHHTDAPSLMFGSMYIIFWILETLEELVSPYVLISFKLHKYCRPKKHLSVGQLENLMILCLCKVMRQYCP